MSEEKSKLQKAREALSWMESELHSAGVKDERRHQLAGDVRAVLNDAPQLDTIPVKRDVLEAWLKEAADDIEDWAVYASEYSQEKYGLAGDIQKWKERAVLLASQEK